MAESGSTASAAASTSAAVTKKKKSSSKLFYTMMHERNIHNVKLLISTVLPVTYEDSLFKRFLGFPEEYCKLAFFDDIFVGCFACRPEGDGRLYMMVLALLAPYRRRGIGSAMMQELMDAVETPTSGIKEIYLHVHTANTEAQRFYERFGFVKGNNGEAVKSYYRGIEPPDAFVYRKPCNGAKLEDLPPLPAHAVGSAPAAAAGK